ncbi:MAG: hypothetical protein CM15mL5_2340 [uncultured marine virus]|nr:MAG: hypothetical protein CM15mL5_2340 [uncultured marine virus]
MDLWYLTDYWSLFVKGMWAKFQFFVFPLYFKVGISTARKVEAVVYTIFKKGETATSIITR